MRFQRGTVGLQRSRLKNYYSPIWIAMWCAHDIQHEIVAVPGPVAAVAARRRRSVYVLEQQAVELFAVLVVFADPICKPNCDLLLRGRFRMKERLVHVESKPVLAFFETRQLIRE